MTAASDHVTLVWFRDDLRVADHEALSAARADGRVIGVWIREKRDADGLGPRPLGGAARWWAHESLAVLEDELETLGIPLLFAAGEAATILPLMAADLEVDAVRWSRRYAPASRDLDARIKADLDEQGLTVHSHPGSLLVEPWTIAPESSDHYKVFTPYWKAVRDRHIDDVLPAPEKQQGFSAARLDPARKRQAVTDLNGLGLLDGTDTGSGEFAAARTPRWWQDTIAEHWTGPHRPGCRAADDHLGELSDGIGDYRSAHDIPGDPDSTSRMSPRLRHGELSPRQLLHAAESAPVAESDKQAWIRQLYWREFSWHLAYHHHNIATEPIREEFARFPYEDDPEALAHWQAGTTGIDLVDAGMAQLWQMGWMHNRVRMVTASLLTKNLLQPWWNGEQWFWDTLVDADEANNPVSWQWVAGCGADAAPYFRIFNPERQAERFDPHGEYVAQWLGQGPAGDPRNDDSGAEAEAGESGDAGSAGSGSAGAQTEDSGAEAGADVTPIVDLKESREAALAAYDRMKNETTR